MDRIEWEENYIERAKCIYQNLFRHITVLSVCFPFFLVFSYLNFRFQAIAILLNADGD